ncbi:MAG: mechanosensitive ion channel family protein, partial [Burkholderiales bacterium]|nr:mechanosensitive ion channel family protein [Burkholderiales bacterium]
RLAFRFASNRLPPTRLRHSAWALVRTLLSALAYGLAAYAVAWGFDWHGDSPSAVTLLVGNLVGLVVFGTFVRAMGHAVLSARHPGWRLPPLTDEVAHGLRHFPLSFAAVMAGGLLLERLAGLLNAGLATTVAINCLIALGLGGLMANGLRRGLALHRKSVAAMPRPADGRSRGLPWTAVLVGALYLTLLASLVCVLVGYVALGSFVVKQIAWGATVLCTVYLLNVLIDDLFVTWLGAATTSGESESGAAADDTDRSLRVRRQFAVLLSGLCRIFVVICALVVLAAPFGQGPLELLQRTEQLQQGIAVGELQLLPGAVLQAVLVFIVGLTAVRLLQRWLKQRYLPTTTIEPAMRDSMTTLLGFVGSIIALAFALSAVGLSLERIAWVASALSVGIGFGLQAIVSNFVSGLILLAERPVKVGDWVALGGVEGDIRRINVRATEIQQGDRSTVIVPNSEFITKIVRNVTLANPFGLVQIKLPLPLDTDVEQVRTLILEAFKAHESLLEVPGPHVFLDTIDAANVVFNANGSVASPRQVYGVRSALLFDILKRLREAGVVLSRPSTLLLQPGSVDPLNPAATPPAAP